MRAPLLAVHNLTKTYRSGGREVKGLDNVSMSVAAGETIGLVGPSGSGKSTLARVVMRLIEPDSGTIAFGDENLGALSGKALRSMRKRIQMVFQDPSAAFNPRATVADVLADPLRIHGLASRAERPRRIAELLDSVGLPANLAARPVHAVSGGQRQRVAIARALATEPELIVLDEAVSALDVTVRGQILDLLVALQRERGLAYLFVSHDLAVVRAVSHRIAIMDRGRIVEAGPAATVVADPQSETGRALVAAIPRLHIPRLHTLQPHTSQPHGEASQNA
ncbi:peptide/nickel transport system ATP-binding protein [Aquamicrobium lusatiense]|uniref:Peptide/nickel transport system ATP-binding protein n=1 Tax=Aquamicrobium lusatiense TaxID=89772 RepID=A0A7W9S6P2_9HYPH|nr:ATP-binding cassette domain-containing protein [Aquamicrobium lusatiense]MBB6014003.1 peptide/nickel transport system ATP-binding protein [Aquamicrobium lusatiense]